MKNIYYKIMWLPGEESIIWNMLTETQISVDSLLYQNFTSIFNIEKWKSKYERCYKNWLNKDDLTIFDLDGPLLKDVISSVKIFNKKYRERLLYWYEPEPTTDEYKWPKFLDSSKCLNLGKEYPEINRMICIDEGLVLPEGR